MEIAGRIVNLWALVWRGENKIDGKRNHIINKNCVPLLFLTRQQAREYNEEHYGYIRQRPDLREEPHGWKMPLPIKVKVVNQSL